MGADLALFPEMWSVGYKIPENIGELKSTAVPADGSFVSAFGEAAKALEMAVESLFRAAEPLPRNTVCIFDRFGRRVLTFCQGTYL